MRINLTHAILAAFAIAIAVPALADGPGQAGPDVAAPPVRAAPVRAAPVEAAPEGRTGAISLSDGDITLNVPRGYRFYPAEEAYAYIRRNNSAQPSGNVFGLLAPASANVRAPGTWATIVSYDAIGYVPSETASGLADANFEADVRTARASQSRVFEGFAAPATFQAETPELVWAERVAAPGSQTTADLRFEQKTLARAGVVTMTSIGSADQMPAMQAAAADYKAMLSFAEGKRYADFQAASDQVSSYTVPGLVTGVSATQVVAGQAGAEGEQQSGSGGLAGWFPWIALGVVGLAGAGYMLTRKRGPDVDDDDDDDAADDAKKE